MSSKDDYRFMAKAIELAKNGLYTTDPNPRVGCVLVKHGVIVGEGWHDKAGGPHAEINALQAAGDNAKGATAYVSLEPCSHHGRTPPCSEALINAQVTRVVAAMQDPNPVVAGNGLQLLAQAGIAVTTGVMESQAQSLNPGHIMRMNSGRPYVRSKLAMSLDGRTAMANGESKWITGTAARHDVHFLRARSSAIFTGIGTVLADDPALNVRIEHLHYFPPIRVIVDSALKMPPSVKMLSLPGRTVILTCSSDQQKVDKLIEKGAEIVRIESTHNQVNLQQAFSRLAAMQINEVLVEAGSTLNAALLQAGLIDEIIIYMAAKIMGDKARGLFDLKNIISMEQSISLRIADIRAVGDDWRITAYPVIGAQ